MLESGRQTDLQEILQDAEEELFLLRCALRCLMEDMEGGRELRGLWRLTDYLEQHMGDIRLLCRQGRG